MDRRGMSRTQRFFTRLAGAETAAAMEAHSRAWLLHCPDCGHERSIWDIGGIRYKAAGNPRTRTRMRCPKCGKTGWHKVIRAANFPTTHAPAWPMVRLILSLVLGLLIIAALIAGVALKLTGAV